MTPRTKNLRRIRRQAQKLEAAQRRRAAPRADVYRRSIAVGAPIVTLLEPLAILGTALLLSLLTIVGQGVALHFYEALAQVLPVLFLAGILEHRLNSRRWVEQDQRAGQLADETRTIMIGIARSYIVLFALGEGASLWALATETSTTFVFATACLSGAAFLLFLFSSIAHQVEALPSPLAEFVNQYEGVRREAMLVRADQAETRAEVLRSTGLERDQPLAEAYDREAASLREAAGQAPREK